MLVPNGAVRADHEGLGHAVDAPIDGRAPRRIGADGGEGVAEVAQEAASVVGIVLVVDADDPDGRVLGQLDEGRMLLPARHAPRRPHVHDRHPALEVGVGKARHGRARFRQARHGVEGEGWHRAADQGGRHARGVAREQAHQEQQRQSRKHEERQDVEEAQATGRVAALAGRRGVSRRHAESAVGLGHSSASGGAERRAAGSCGGRLRTARDPARLELSERPHLNSMVEHGAQDQRGHDERRCRVGGGDEEGVRPEIHGSSPSCAEKWRPLFGTTSCSTP